jgi:hypothetical protein
MSLNIKLVDSDVQIEKKINLAIAGELNALIKKKSARVERQLGFAIHGWIMKQPEISSLEREGVPNTLNSQFGLNPGEATVSVAEIVNAVVASIEVEIRPIDDRLKGGVDFLVQPASLRNLLNLPSGFVVALSGPLHWLSWLLTEGTSTIVYGFSYTPSLSGRSGGGTMSSGGVWRIPPQYSGVHSDNFITRALSGNDSELSSILGDIFQ